MTAGEADLARRLELLMHLAGDEGALVAPWRRGRATPPNATLLVVPDDLSDVDAARVPAHLPRMSASQVRHLLGIRPAMPLRGNLTEQSARALVSRLESLEEHALRVGHDFSGPLLAISTGASAARHHLEHREYRKADALLAGVEQTAESVRHRMRELLETARSGLAPAPTCRRDALALARAAIARASRLAPDLRAILPRKKNPTWVMANEDLAVEALTNLYANAGLHGGRKGGTARVTTRLVVRGKTAALVIEDRGPGIAPDLLGDMLNPFVRGNTDAPGSGVGLTLALQAMRSQGGGLRLESPATSDPDSPGLRASAFFRLWER